MERKDYKIEGMSCTSCAINVEKALKSTKGIKDAKVNFATGVATIDMSESVPFEKLSLVVQEAGYKLVKEEDEEEELKFIKREKKRLIFSWIFTLPLALKMILSMFFKIGFQNDFISMIIDLIISFIVIFIFGFDVIRNTFYSIKKLSFTMDSLIGIGTVASFLTGLLKLAKINIEDFSVVGAMIMSINHIGNYLKQLSTGKASLAIKKLIQLGAKNAHKIVNDQIIDVDISEIQIGDIVLVKPGEKIPSDGLIIEGNAAINESIATGESLPVDKKEGDKVLGATINESGVIKVKIEKIGKDTFLSQIISLVQQAQASKVPIQELADKVTSYFVPIIIAVSLFTFIFWYFFPQFFYSLSHIFSKIFALKSMIPKDRFSMALFASIATLVIACPCALGLATPTALMVGMGKAALNGILIRKGDSIQKMKDVSIIVFDKTGTITEGKPKVINYISIDENSLFNITYSLENLSDHPLAKSIVNWIKLQKPYIEILKVEDYISIAGKGIKARIDDKPALCGSLNLLESEGINIPDDIKKQINSWIQDGHTIVYSSFDNKLLGVFSISDAIKEDTRIVIEKLHSLNLKTIMLTGDNRLAAEYISKKAGIDEFYYELMPEDKINIIKKLQNNKEIVAMVGDGINDAPALKQADVGIAIAVGTDIAIESADIAVSGNNLDEVYKSFIISQKTFQKIKQNLFWAFFYNIIAIPLAMLGILHPIIAEIAMAFSSINVVTNSLRLNKINFK